MQYFFYSSTNSPEKNLTDAFTVTTSPVNIRHSIDNVN